MNNFFGLFFLMVWVAGELPRLLFLWPMALLDIATVALLLWNAPRIKFYKTLRNFFLILLGSWFLSLRLFSIGEMFQGLLYLVRACLYTLLIVNAPHMLQGVKKYVSLALWAFIVLGLFQYCFIPDSRFLLRYGWDEHYYRLIGTVLDPNYAGAMYGMIGLFGLDRFLSSRKRTGVLLGIFSTVALVLTLSRASWISTGVALIFCLISKGPTFHRRSDLYKMAVGVSVVSILVFFIAPKPGGEGVNLFRTNSIAQRVKTWEQAVMMWKTYPLLGVGFNNYNVSSQKLHFDIDPKSHAANSPDSSWLLLLSTTGAIGVVLLVKFAFLPLLKMYYNPSGRTSYNTFYISAILLMAVHALFNNTLFYPPILGLFVLLIAAKSP